MIEIGPELAKIHDQFKQIPEWCPLKEKEK